MIVGRHEELDLVDDAETAIAQFDAAKNTPDFEMFVTYLALASRLQNVE